MRLWIMGSTVIKGSMRRMYFSEFSCRFSLVVWASLWLHTFLIIVGFIFNFFIVSFLLSF